jgi:hypothetical protein
MTKIVNPLLAALFAAYALWLLSACKVDPKPVVWLGMDRSAVACATVGEHYPWNRVRCVGAGRLFECVSEGDNTWQCAEAKLSSLSVELAQ